MRERLDNFGGHCGGGTPLPIPNREVKPASADGTRRATSRESRSPPNYFENGPRKRPVSVLGDYAAWRVASPAISPKVASTYRAARSSSPITGSWSTPSVPQPRDPDRQTGAACGSRVGTRRGGGRGDRGASGPMPV